MVGGQERGATRGEEGVKEGKEGAMKEEEEEEPDSSPMGGGGECSWAAASCECPRRVLGVGAGGWGGWVGGWGYQQGGLRGGVKDEKD